jgi:FSR family fosmidomycin resistance protein-like MFS transporter
MAEVSLLFSVFGTILLSCVFTDTLKSRCGMEKKKVIMLGLMHFFLDMHMSFFPIYFVIAQLDPTRAALIISVSAFVGNILQPLMGYASDRLHAKPPLFVGMLITATSMSLIGRTVQYTPLFFLVLMGHLGSSLFHPAGAHGSSIAGMTKKDASFAVYSTLGFVGFSLSQPIFSAFTGRFGVGNSSLLAIPTISIAFFYLLISKGENQERRQTPHLNEVAGLLLRRSGPVLLLFFIMVFRSAFVFSMNSFLAKSFEEWGYARGIYSSANTFFSIFGSAGVFAAGHLASIIRPRKLMFFSLVGFFPFFLLFLYFGGLGNLTSTFVLLSITGFIVHGGHGMNIVMGHRIAPEMMSTISGILMGFAWAVSQFGPILCATTSGLFAGIGKISSGLFVMSFFPLIAAALSLLLPKEVDG